MDSNLLALEAILWSVAVSRWTVTFNTKWSMIAIHFPILCAQGDYLSRFCNPAIFQSNLIQKRSFISLIRLKYFVALP